MCFSSFLETGFKVENIIVCLSLFLWQIQRLFIGHSQQRPHNFWCQIVNLFFSFTSRGWPSSVICWAGKLGSLNEFCLVVTKTEATALVMQLEQVQSRISASNWNGRKWNLTIPACSQPSIENSSGNLRKISAVI